MLEPFDLRTNEAVVLEKGSADVESLGVVGEVVDPLEEGSPARPEQAVLGRRPLHVEAKECSAENVGRRFDVHVGD